jgi:hypothetical protein
MPNVRFAVGIQRLIPFLGYHHVLMILIALAIILLCKFSCRDDTHQPDMILIISLSTTTGRLLVLLPSDPRHLPDQLLLR